jgi:hypothetical protein
MIPLYANIVKMLYFAVIAKLFKIQKEKVNLLVQFANQLRNQEN